MRIGLFTDTFPPEVNGVATSVSMLKNALEEKGHEVFLVTTASDDTKQGYDETTHTLRVWGIKIPKIYGYRLTSFYPINLVNEVKKWKLDVIHVHTDFGVGIFGKVFARQHNIPLVYTYHTMYEDYAYYLTKGKFKKISNYLVRETSKLLCNRIVSELIVPGKNAKDLWKKKYKIDRTIHIVSNGVDIRKFYRENHDPKEIAKLKKQYRLKEEDFVIIFVGRIASEKNIEKLITMQKKLVDKDPKYKLVLVGDGPDMAKYKKKVKDLKIDKNVVFTGKVPLEDVAKYYQLANVFATASVTETQGMTVFEGLAASLPAICIEDNSFHQMVKEEYNGGFYQTDEEYVKQITSLAKNKKKYNLYAKNARESSAPFSSERYAEKILRIYKKAIKENPDSNIPIIKDINNIVKKGGTHEK